MTSRAILTIAFVVPAIVYLSSSEARAQQKTSETNVKYWISFVDKDNGTGKGPASVEPGFVTERARRRRALRAKPASRSLDVPVSNHYQTELQDLGVEPLIESRWLNAVSAWLTPEQLAVVSKLDFVRSVDPVAQSVEMSAEPEPVVVAGAVPDANSLDYGLALNQLQLINAVGSIEEGLNGDGILLGFLDTTTDTLHPALAHLHESGRVVAVRDFTAEAGLSVQGNRHGLNTSTTALAFDEGNLIGACYGAEYIFATTEYAPFERNQEEDFFVAGMEWMERMGADIVNVSLGYSTFDAGQSSYTYENMDGKTAKTTIAADMAVDLGVVVVSSAGNEGGRSSAADGFGITSPSDGFGVIAAGAVNSADQVVSFSGRGPSFDGRTKPDLAALGTGVAYGCLPPGSFGCNVDGYSTGGSGTSFSSPLIASVACQILQANPTLTPADVRTILRSTASQPNAPDNDIGWGVINGDAAVALAKTATTSRESDGSVPDEAASLNVFPNPTSDRAVVTLQSEDPELRVSVTLYDILGRKVRSAEREPAAIGPGIFRLEVADLTPGLYLVRAEGSEFELLKGLVVR